MKYTYFPVLVIGLSLLVIAPAFANTPELVEKIQDRYQSISSFQGRFVQRNYINQEQKPREAAGTIAYSRPGKMRWNYETPDEQLLVTDGNTLWLYDPLLENVTVQVLQEVTQGTPLSFLLGAGDLTEEFTQRPVSQELTTVKDALVVELVPSSGLGELDFIQLGVRPDTFDLQQIVLMDSQGNYRILEFQEMAYNLELDAQQFHFEITAGMEVIRANE